MDEDLDSGNMRFCHPTATFYHRQKTIGLGNRTFTRTMTHERLDAPAVHRFALEDFFRNPEKSGFQISPDGNHFAYLAPWNQRMNLFVVPTDGEGQAHRLTDVTDRDISGYMWSTGTRLLYLKDNGGDENFALFGVDTDGGNVTPLTAFDKVRTQLIDALDDDDDHVLVGLNRRVAQVFDPYRLNVHSGELTLLAENPGNISAWITDHAGVLRLAVRTDGVNTSLMHRATEQDAWTDLFTLNFKETLYPLFFTFDNTDFYAASNIGRDKTAIIRYSIAENREIEELFASEAADVSNLNFSRKRKVLTSITYTTDRKQRVFLDDRAEALYNRLKSALPDLEVAVSGTNKEEDKFIVRTYSDRSLGAYYFFDQSTDELRKIEEVSPWLNPDQLSTMRTIHYAARDGLRIQGYLTLPADYSDGRIPIVVNPHGGPWARDTWGFNPEVQFLANRGYGVLQMNFRGSTGFGRAFWEASFKEWGKKMQDDITDGVQWLVAEGIADPKRVAIYGGSYGGYATLAGLAFTPEVYACGVDYVGVSNLFTFMQTIPPYWEPYLEMMYEMVGHPEQDKAAMAAASPVMHADKISVPLLIAQGAKDPRVNVDESDQMVAAMRERGVEVEYLVEPEEGHGFRNEENRFKFYRAMERFLAEHL